MRTITLTHEEALPMIMSLIYSGREDLAYQQLEKMARKADAFGREIELVVVEDQILVVAIGIAEPVATYDYTPTRLQDLETHYPSATTVFV